MPDDITASTRWNTDKLYYSGILKEPRPNSMSHEDSLYYSTCFLKLQNEIDQAFIKIINNGPTVNKLKTLKTFPTPKVEVDNFVISVAKIIPIIFVFSLTFSVFMLIKVRIVDIEVIVSILRL